MGDAAMGGPEDRRDASPRVPPQSEDFQETAQVIPPEQVRRIEADPTHGGRAFLDPDRPRAGRSDPVPAERDMPQATRSSQPPTTVVDRRVANDRYVPPSDAGDRHAGPGHAADDRAMLKDPEMGYGGRHRPQASDFYRLPPGDTTLPAIDARRRHAATPPAARLKVAGPGLLIAGALFGLATLVSLRVWAVSRR
jgi:hypothetical protein